MLNANRLRETMERRQVSQSELARRVGVSQTTIAKLTSGRGYGSKHLHRIARELGTTPAFLEGEIDDPDLNAPAPPPAPRIQHVMLPVALPSENALAQMFEGLLEAVDRSAPADEVARELAQLLPTALSQMKGPLLEAAASGSAPAAAAPAARATEDLGSPR